MKKPMNKKAKISIIVVVAIGSVYLLTALIALLAAFGQNKAAHDYWAQQQIERISYLKTEYEKNTFQHIDEQNFAAFNINQAIINGSKINEVQYLATHNSYKTGLVPATKFLYHGPLFAIMGDKYDYYFDTFTEQLNQGIRSFELDPNYVKKDDGTYTVECVHSSLLEACSTAVDFQLALTEFKLWMDYNPSHMPLIILLEPKGEDSYVADAFKLYDQMISDTFGDKLITPKDFLGDTYADFDAFRKDNAYPTIGEAQGKIMFLLHDKKYVDNYIKDYNTIKEWKLFPALNYSLLEERPDVSKFSCFAISNDASDDERIKSLIERGYMVRTRLDEYSKISEEGLEKGVASGANIMSSDYPPTNSKRYDYTCYIDKDNKNVTIQMRENKG